MADPNSPAVVFQSLLRSMLDGSSRTLTKRNVEDFRVILHMIMHECSKANIETGKTWVFEHCHSAAHTVALMQYILSLSKSRSGQEERIHIIYLLNDILFHTARKQLGWMKDAMLPTLVPLLKLAYEAAESGEYEAKVMKVITFWSDKNIFEPNIINNIRRDVTGQATLVYQPQFRQNTNQQSPLSYHQQRYQQTPPPLSSFQPYPPMQPQYQEEFVAQRSLQYHEMPAGLMLLAKNGDYMPMDPALIKYPFPRPQPSKELLNAVNDFYAELDLSNADDMILGEKSFSANHIDVQGWEKGYLDNYLESVAQRKKELLMNRQQQISGSRSREYRSSYGNSREYDHRSRSPSPPHHTLYRRRRSYSRSRSRSPPHRRRSPISRRGEERSPPPRRGYNSRRSYNSRSRSRSRSPPPPSASFKPSYGPRGADFNPGTSVTPENRYMGLGAKSSLDEFDSFRRNKSQAFNRREPHQPMTCYRCNKVGHLARECNSL